MTDKKTNKGIGRPKYNYTDDLEDLMISNMLRNSFRLYLNKNTIQLSSKSDLLKELEKFKKTNIGR